jgi:hypothetical protein
MDSQDVVRFLLEKSRVALHCHGERNFHVFYHVITSLSVTIVISQFAFQLLLLSKRQPSLADTLLVVIVNAFCIVF